MGALEIRMSSQNLKPLGSFRMPELDTGAARMWDAQARAAQAAAQAIHTAGMAKVDGIARRGQIVANTLGNLGKLAMDLYNRENERVADEAYLELKRQTQAELYGDENGKVGRFNEKPDDMMKWMQDLRQWNDTTVENLSKDMSSAQRRLFTRKIADQQLGLQTSAAQHAARYTQERERTTARAISADAMQTAALQFGNPELRDPAIAKYIAAKEREFEVNGVPETARKPLMRTAMRDLLTKGWDNQIVTWSAASAANGDPKAVEAEWKAHREAAKNANYSLVCPSMKAYMPDGLTDAEKAMYEKRIDAAAKQAVGLAYQRQHEETKAATDAAHRAVVDLYASKDMPDLDPNDPNSVRAHYGYLSLGLARIGTDPNLLARNPSMSRSLVEAANNLETQIAVKTAGNADADVDATYQADYNPDTFGYVVGGRFHTMTTGEAIQRATDAFNRHEISAKRYKECMISCTKHMNADDQAFLDAACEAVEMMCPGALSHDRNGDFSVRLSGIPSGKRKKGAAASTGITRVIEEDGGVMWFDKTEDVTYAQFAKALGYFRKQILRDEKAGKRKSDEEYLSKFRELVKPTVEAWNKQKLDDTLMMIDSSFRAGEDWMERIRIK